MCAKAVLYIERATIAKESENFTKQTLLDTILKHETVVRDEPTHTLPHKNSNAA